MYHVLKVISHIHTHKHTGTYTHIYTFTFWFSYLSSIWRFWSRELYDESSAFLQWKIPHHLPFIVCIGQSVLIHFLFLTIKEMCDLNNSCRNKIIHFKNLWYLQGRFLFIFLYSNWLPLISVGKALWLCHYNCEMRQKGIFSFKAANLFSMYLYFLFQS